jgi:hypothetical protein
MKRINSKRAGGGRGKKKALVERIVLKYIGS